MTARPHDHKPHEKMPEHLSTNKKSETKEDKIDAQMADTFPASDPPSYSGGNHIVGAPSGRESDALAPGNSDVADAGKKAKGRGASKKH
jgi:predicted 2-oxoglutarate/Fe(II)-dependent dioxygenase YbiX